MALAPVIWHWLVAIDRAVDAMEEIVHLAPDLADMSWKPLEKVLELLVQANDELLHVALDSARRDVLASLLATQPAYS